MKTRDRILETSLELFNLEGEQNVTTVDIANEMGISPGNLYYHFKGKEAIIEALFDSFYNEFNGLLQAPAEGDLNLEDYWFYIYVVLEEMHKFRFFYLNIVDLIQRAPKIRKRFQRLLDTKRRLILDICTMLEHRDVITAEEATHRQIADSITMGLVYWFSYQQLMFGKTDYNELMHGGVYHVLSLVAPHLVGQQGDFHQSLQSLYEAVLNKVD